MTVAIVEVEVEYAGKSRNSIHAAHINDSAGNTDANLLYGAVAALGWEELADAGLENRTDLHHPDVELITFLPSVIALHRFMQHASATIKGIRVSEVPHIDGRPSLGISKRLNLSCLGYSVPVPFDEMENANVVLQIAKNTNVIGADNGSVNLRGALTKESTVGDALDGVVLQGANVPLYVISLNEACGSLLDTMGLKTFLRPEFDTEVANSVTYVVVNTEESATLVTREGNPKRVFNTALPVNALEIVDAQSRDARRRGKKRSSGSGSGEV